MVIIKWRKTIKDFLIFFMAIEIACFGGYFISNGFGGLLGLLISTNNRFFGRLLYFLFYFLIVLLVSFFVSYKIEYKRESFNPVETVTSVFISCMLQLLAAVIIVFSIYTAGPAIPFAHIVYAGKDINRFFLDTEIPIRIYVICMVVLDVFYISSATLGGYCGQKKRKRNRELLQKKTQGEPEHEQDG